MEFGYKTTRSTRLQCMLHGTLFVTYVIVFRNLLLDYTDIVSDWSFDEDDSSTAIADGV